MTVHEVQLTRRVTVAEGTMAFHFTHPPGFRCQLLNERSGVAASHVNRLPRTAERQRVNGHSWPEPLPAATNLLPRR